MPSDVRAKEFLFVDESGDPGVSGTDFYVLVGLHIAETVLDRIRPHLVAFRYHHEVAKEFKNQRWAKEFKPHTRKLLEPFAQLTEEGLIATTAVWLDKSTYVSGGGPYLSGSGETAQFRHYQLRRLLETHRSRREWSNHLDLVIDRWDFDLSAHRDLEDYLRGNYRLRPRIAAVTQVDSAYSDPIQVVDVYAALVKRVIKNLAAEEEEALASRLVDLHQITGGLYPP
jgi:hypothetical protein